MADITVGATTTTTVSNTTTDPVLAVPSGATEGSILLASIASTAPVTPPADWFTAAGPVGPWSSRRTQLWYHVVTAVAEPASYTFVMGGTASAACAMTVFYDVDITAVVNTSGGVLSSTPAASVVLPSIVTTRDKCMLVASLGGTIVSWTPPGSMTERSDLASAASNRCSNETATELAGTAGATGTRTFTPNASTAYGGILLALNPKLARGWVVGSVQI